MKAFNTILQWFFWIVGLSGLCIGMAIAVTGRWTSGIVASILCFGTSVPVGNFFKSRRELARASVGSR